MTSTLYSKKATTMAVIAAAFLSVFAVAHGFFLGQVGDTNPSPEVAYRSDDVLHSSSSYSASSPQALQTAMDSRVAVRLQKRVAFRYGIQLPVEILEQSLREQRQLLGKSVTVHFSTDDGTVVPPLTVTAGTYPALIHVDMTSNGFQSHIDAFELSQAIKDNLPEGIRMPENATITSTFVDKKVQKASTDGIAKTGYDFSPDGVASIIREAMSNPPEKSILIELHTVAGQVANNTGENLGALQLLATGKSNFEGSGEGRKANVRKGLTKYLHNTIVPAGQKFSINSVFAGVPMSEWEMALGIFDGGKLLPVAGGGLCQVATTLYRAALLSGFPIINRANHSLYVHYYEKYGVGMDATIFPGKQDLTFLNNTSGALLIQSYVEGYEARVNIYGTPDGRHATLVGPYFSVNTPSDLMPDGKSLHYNEIGWKQEIRFADGRTESNTIVSRYKSVPKSVVKQYLHAAASGSLAM